ncbi:hypothetical protein ABPG72_002546 [Tetrahymena utriculariae]
MKVFVSIYYISQHTQCINNSNNKQLKISTLAHNFGSPVKQMIQGQVLQLLQERNRQKQKLTIKKSGYGSYGETGYYKVNEDKYEYCYDFPDERSTSQEITIGNQYSDVNILCNVQWNQYPQSKWSQNGHFNRNGGGCKDCEEGKYSFQGSKSCNLKPCGYGFYSETDSCEKQCRNSTKQENTKGNDDSVCDLVTKKCPEGKFSQTGYDYDGKGSGCINCQDDTYSDEGSKSCDLIPCDYGFYSSNGYYNENLQAKCEACLVGKSTKQQKTNGNSDSVCDMELQKCPEGTQSKIGYEVQSKGSQCKDCEYSTSSEVGSTTCNKILCGFGFYSERGYYYENEDNDCKKCPDDKSTSEQNTIGNNELACNLQLKKCPEGSYSTLGYDSNSTGGGCQQCGFDYYSYEGSSECNLKRYGQGFYSRSGYYNFNNKDAKNQCKKCPTGKSTSSFIQKGVNDSACDLQLELCPEGKWSYIGYNNPYEYGQHCYNCKQDYYSLQGSKEQTGRKACPKNTTTKEHKTKGLANTVCSEYYRGI